MRDKSIHILIIMSFFAINFGFSQNAKFDWGHISASPNSSDNGWAIALDGSGKIFHAGAFTQTLDAAPGSGVVSLTSNGDRDCFVRKLDENQNLLWAKSFGGNLFDGIYDVTCDNSGNVICIGDFRDSVDFDPGTNEFNLFAQNKAFFVLKLDSNGNFLWAFSVDYINPTFVVSVSCDDQNNIFIGGMFRDSIDLDPSISEAIFYPTNLVCGYIAKYSSSGNYVYAKTLTGGNSSVVDIKVDNMGNIVGVGAFVGSVDFNPGVGVDNETSSVSATSEPFIWKLDGSGNYLWSSFFKEGTDCNAVDVETNNNGDVFVSGTLKGTIDFDPGPLVNYRTSYTDNGGLTYQVNPYLVKLNSTGDVVWVDLFLGAGSARTDDLAVDEQGSIYIIGEHDEWYDFDPSPMGVYELRDSGSGGDDIYILKIADNSDLVWAKQLEGVFYTRNDIEVDTTNGFVYCSGTLINLVDLNPGYGTYNVSTASVDYFLLKLQPCVPSFYTDNVAACGVSSYQWINGFTYTSNNNTAKHILQAANGCDSIISLNLTFGSSNSGSNLISACESYTWINGVTYTASTSSPTYVLQNAAGCDSTVSLNLTIYQSNVTTDVVQACGQYTWIDGNTYTSNNNSAQFLLTNNNGCDSLVQLNLTFGAPNSGTDVISACDSYTWIDGNTYTASNNSATYILPNAYGCDSTVSLDLTINSSYFATDAITECDSYTWIDGNTYTASNNSATYVLTNAQGCDSTRVLDLIILNSTSGTETVSTCNDFTWIDGNTYSSSTTATHTLVGGASNGCDSTVTLNLTIVPLNLSISSNDPVLFGPFGVSGFQWLDCNNGFAPIIGATASTFTPMQNGSYAVQVEENGCFDTTVCLTITQANANLIDLTETNWTVYPNPTSDKVTINFQESLKEITIEVADPLGQIVRKQTFENAEEIELTLGFEPGLYFVRIIVEGKEAILPIIKL